MQPRRSSAVPLRRQAALAACALALTVSAGFADSVTITPDAARAGLRAALSQGRDRDAWYLARGLIAAVPQDYAGHAGLAQAEARLGRPAAALAAARAAQARAEAPVQRFEAALLRAQAHEAAGGVTGTLAAQFWTRRAHDLAPDTVHAQAAAGEVQRLRRASRLSLRLDLTAAPSDNVNNGTRASVIDFFGLPFAVSPQSRALAGWIGQASLSGRWRLAESRQSATALRFAAVRREVRLSASALAALERWRLDELARGNVVVPQTDFDFAAIEAGLTHRRVLGKAVMDAGLTLGHNWFAGRDLTDYARLDLGWERALTRETGLFGALALERQWRHDSPLRDADQMTVQAGFTRTLPAGALRLTLGARRLHSASRDTAHNALTARLGWEHSRPLAGIRLAAALHAERRHYGATLLATAGRRDLRVGADLSLTFERLDVMGFAPTLDIQASRTRSSLRLHDGRDLGLTLGFRSVF